MLDYSSILSWFKFYFPLFLGMVVHDNEFETKENKFKLKLKLNHKFTYKIHGQNSFFSKIYKKNS